jgi:tetratricopeptide (TPR) repeat protein/DNA-binding CsgD family transcriptional regulator
MNRIILLLFLLLSLCCHSQESLRSLKNDFSIGELRELPAWKEITSTDDTAGNIHRLEQEALAKDDERSANRVNLFKCLYLITSNRSLYDGNNGVTWADIAMKNAARLNDDIALTHAYNFYGYFMLVRGRSDTGILYFLKSLDLYEKNGRRPETLLDHKVFVSTYLYRLHNYELCKQYCQEAIKGYQHLYDPVKLIVAWNNLGLYYEKKSNPDSAIYCFRIVEELAKQQKQTAWYGISVGNIGDAYEMKGDWQKAMNYWQQDYDTSLKYGSRRNAGLTLAKMSLYHFKEGKREQAMRQLDQAMAWGKGSMLVLPTVYRIKAECFKMMKNTDSAWHYLQLYQNLTDTLEATASRNSQSYLQLKLNFDETAHKYETMQKEKQAETIIRNLMLAGIAALVIIGLLFYNRQRLKYRHEKQLAVQKQQAAETEIKTAREQLAFFTRNMLEKTEMIEQLNNRLNDRQQTANDELRGHVILTEDDWQHFRSLFEKIYPGFFDQLRSAAPEITTAEMRMAALIRLDLNNKQIASMQGISPVSVRSTKARLRQRLNITLEDGLETYVQSL